MLNEKLEDKTINQMQPLVLAMIGDSVQTLFVRTEVALKYGVKVNKMNKLVSSVVQAGAKFRTFKKFEEGVTEQKKDIARRARNTHIHTKAKNFSYNEYIYATALEAVIGYLYLSGQEDRLQEILKKSLEEINLDI